MKTSAGARAGENNEGGLTVKIIDITRALEDVTLYPGPSEEDRRFGTHADAFDRYFPGKGMSIDQMPLDSYCGNCRVISVPGDGLITTEDMRGQLHGAKRIVLRGGGGAYLCEEAARYLASCKIKLLVTDAPSVADSGSDAEIHRILFEAGIAVVENADLDKVADGKYLIFAFPIKYTGRDSAPVRAVLVRE